MAMIALPTPAPRTAAIAMASRIGGNAKNTSITRPQQLVEPAAEPGQEAERAPAQERQDRRAGDAERDAHAEEDAREEVAAEAVGAERWRRARRLEDVRWASTAVGE